MKTSASVMPVRQAFHDVHGRTASIIDGGNMLKILPGNEQYKNGQAKISPESGSVAQWLF
jgi:hypothetical protein